METRKAAMAIRLIVGERKYDTYIATVKQVSGAECTVERVIDEKLFENVRINVNSNEEQGVVITPKIDSNVLVTTIDGINWFVSQYSEIEGIALKTDKEITIYADKVTFNSGNNDGLVKINELTQKINELVQKFNTHTHQVATTGNAAAQSGTAAPTTSQAAVFQKSDYEDTKVIH